MTTNQNIKIIELRNYLLKPDTTDNFAHYFNTHFVEAMTELGGYTLGRYKIKNEEDRFFWIRGFTSMQHRVKFLNDFYLKSETWKRFGPGANEMMINSDNVYLLRPLSIGKKIHEPNEGISSNNFENDYEIAVIDFYIANSRLNELVDLFNIAYLPFLQSLKVTTTNLWISEMAENDFPVLPAFQDRNLLVAITYYKNKEDFKIKSGQIDLEITTELKRKMQEVITIQNKLVLNKLSNQ